MSFFCELVKSGGAFEYSLKFHIERRFLCMIRKHWGMIIHAENSDYLKMKFSMSIFIQ